MKTLTNTQNGSSKVYKIWIKVTPSKVRGGFRTFAVNFAFGKIGGVLQTGTKGNLLTKGEAIHRADKLTASKLAKGYTLQGPAKPAVLKPAASTHRTKAAPMPAGRAAALKAWVTIRANRAAAAKR
jgi:hypothetical protein